MPAAMPTLTDVSARAPLCRTVQEREIQDLIAFSRGLLLGFTSAFVVFDGALLGFRTSDGVLQGLSHVALSVL